MELRHYGIKGQRWGVRRFQDKTGKLTNAGKERYSDDKNKKHGFKLTDKQKKYIKVGATVAATALVAYGGYKLYKSGKIDQFIQVGKKNLNVKGIDPDTGLKLYSDKNLSVSKLVMDNNPTGSNTNCRANVVSMALRLMGYDTVAKDIPGGSFSEAINKCFKDAKIVEMYNPTKDRITNSILKRYKEGDFGAVANAFNIRNQRMEHTYNWKIENGKVRFFDGQKGLDDFSRYLDYIHPSKMAEIVRLNGLSINTDGIYDFVENRK